MKNDSRLFVFTFIISFLCHLALLIVFIYQPVTAPYKSIAPSVIDVNMVSRKTLEIKTQAKKQIKPSQLKNTTKKYKNNVAVKSKAKLLPSAFSKTTEKKIKTSLKKKTYKPSKVIKKTITQIKKTVEDSRPSPVINAIERIKQKVEADEKNRKEIARKSPVTDRQSTKQVSDLLETYQLEMKYQIRKNWAFSNQIAGKQNNLETIIVFRILENGEIQNLWFEKRSGNTYLDESAKKAILKSNPLPPPPSLIIPKGYHHYDIGFVFTPLGVK